MKIITCNNRFWQALVLFLYLSFVLCIINVYMFLFQGFWGGSVVAFLSLVLMTRYISSVSVFTEQHQKKKSWSDQHLFPLSYCSKRLANVHRRSSGWSENSLPLKNRCANTSLHKQGRWLLHIQMVRCK